MKLFHKQFGSGQPVVILHGLMGMLDNWQTPAKQLAENYEVFILDARNHGHSPHSDVFTYQSMVDDLLEFFDDHSLDEVYLVGHSMGGKTSMKFAQQNPELVAKLVVVDIAAKRYPVHHQQILDGLSAIDLNTVKSRGVAQEILSAYVPEPGVQQFLLKNLYWVERGQLGWRINLEAIKANIVDIGEEVHDQIYEGPTLFIRGDKSDYIQDEDFEDLRIGFPEAFIKTIENAGHWVHAEQPKVFMEALEAFLSE